MYQERSLYATANPEAETFRRDEHWSRILCSLCCKSNGYWFQMYYQQNPGETAQVVGSGTKYSYRQDGWQHWRFVTRLALSPVSL